MAGIIIFKCKFESARCFYVHLALMAYMGDLLDNIAVNIIIISGPLKQFGKPIDGGVPESTMKLMDFL